MEAELLAPAGDFETALAAFGAGANAVYCGLADFSARAFAKNFSNEELKALIAYAHSQRKQVYVTFNTLIDDGQVEDAISTLAELEDLGPDAIIVQDIGVARLCRKHFPKLTLHASTQLVAHNLEGVLALKELGFTRVVLARELSITEIASIAKRCGDVELECFIHGALCYSLSGLCLFGAMEKNRSGNRGKCPYCCRQTIDGKYPFSMKDLRLGEDALKLVDAGVVSLKIEGRMKSPLYVASVTRYYRDILDGAAKRQVTIGDLETVFSRRTTSLYFNGPGETVIDSESLGHRGAEIGNVKRITRDREGFAWLRFHTSRALEKHDGLQFEALNSEGRHLGLGIGEMRSAISRTPVFEVAAGTDVEVKLPEEGGDEWQALKPGSKVFCSMSNAVKRKFPAPAYRPSDYPGQLKLNLIVTLGANGVSVRSEGELVAEAKIDCQLDKAKNPDKTHGAVEKAFSKLGGTDYCLGELTLNDFESRFAPMSVMNDLRRDLVEALDCERERRREEKIQSALADSPQPNAGEAANLPRQTLKLRPGQRVPAGEWDEVVLAINAETELEACQLAGIDVGRVRLALPIYTAEPGFNRLRNQVKRFHRAGYTKWEAADLATLRMLRQLGIVDITADWSLYAFNAHALATLSELGVARFVASPENDAENLQYLAESGYPVEFLAQQSTPLFISLTQPDSPTPETLSVFHHDGLWVTTLPTPRTFAPPVGACLRFDLSWDPA